MIIMKKQIIAGAIIASLAAGTMYVSAATNNNSSTWTTNKTFKESFEGKWFAKHQKMMWEWRWMGIMPQLTDEEKTKLESMTAEQKKAFFEQKITEAKVKAEAKEIVIDKLLAGTALTADEEILRQEIIKERADMKAKKAAMDANMAAMKTIMEKKKAGTVLTTEEQATLDSMKSNMQAWKWRMWGQKWEKKWMNK